MKRLTLTTILLAALSHAPAADAQEARPESIERKSVAVTVYNDNLGVVKDVRRIDLKSGSSEIRLTDVAQLIDPTSVHIKLDGSVIEQNYQYDLVDLNKILQKYLDKDIQLIGKDGKSIQGTLLSALGGQVVLRKADGGLLMIPNIGDYQLSVGSLPEGLITKPTLVWKVQSKKSGKQDVEVQYQTEGMNWHAEYVAVLNENDTQLDLNAWVSIENNSGATYKDATLKLVAGDVNRVQGGPVPQYDTRMKAMSAEAVAPAPEFQEKEFFEYHIYNLQRPSTIAQNETKQISLFEAKDVTARKKFLYRSGGGYYYYRNPDGKSKVAVIVEFENNEKDGLGVPMPKGKVRMYKSDGQSVEFVGEDMVDHTPQKEKVKLKIGDAFDVLAEEVQEDYKQIAKDVIEQKFKIGLTNRKKENIEVEVERYLGLNWEILSSTLPYEKKDAQRVVFKVPVKKDSITDLKFTVRYKY
jgi:hypothetical protein